MARANALMRTRKRIIPKIAGSGNASGTKQLSLPRRTNSSVRSLTLELPMDPVTAENGNVYERTAIEEHIEKNSYDLKSPVTNEPMGKRLLPALPTRNVTEQLVGSGALADDKATKWKAELDIRQKIDALRQKAEGGDASAMFELAKCFSSDFYGWGIKEDDSVAYSWYKRAGDSGDVTSLAEVGWHLVKGRGVDSNNALGMVFIGRAEEAGSDVAAFYLGRWLCKGAHGLPRDPVQGKRLLSKAVDGTCKFKDLGEESIEEAADLLKELDGPAVMITPELSW